MSERKKKRPHHFARRVEPWEVNPTCYADALCKARELHRCAVELFNVGGATLVAVMFMEKYLKGLTELRQFAAESVDMGELIRLSDSGHRVAVERDEAQATKFCKLLLGEFTVTVREQFEIRDESGAPV